MMRDRLIYLKRLLSDDGSIWVHLDTVENHRMRLLLDELFGTENFVAEIVWGKADTSRNDAKQFSEDQDYIYVYSKKRGWKLNRLPRTARQDSIYKARIMIQFHGLLNRVMHLEQEHIKEWFMQSNRLLLEIYYIHL